MSLNFGYKTLKLGAAKMIYIRMKYKIKDVWKWFYGILKRLGRLIVKLKVIKYKKDLFYYLLF